LGRQFLDKGRITVPEDSSRRESTVECGRLLLAEAYVEDLQV
jgi:hypothetical protein